MDPTKRPLFPIYDIMEHWAAFAHSNPDVKCQHHALYLALVNLCKVKGGSSRFALSYQHGMDISGIRSRNTYAAALKELQGWNFLTHTPGANGFKAPIIDVYFCASAEHLLSIYRASTGTPTDTSTGHNKEVIGLRLEVVDVKAAAAKLENEKLALQAEVLSLTAQLAPAPEALKAKTKAEIVAAQVAADGGATYTADTFTALNDAQTFASLMDYLGHVGIDTERYRLDIRGKVKAAALDVPATALGKYIVSYMTREAAAAPLLKPGGPVLLPNQIASNASYVAAPCMGIPNKEDYLKPRPVSQYGGSIT